MEAVGIKIARIPKQLIRTPAIATALGKSIKPTIGGLKQYSVIAGQSISSKAKHSPRTMTSFSAIRYFSVLVLIY